MKLAHRLALAAAAILVSPLPASAAGPDRASKPAARQQAAPALAASIQAAVAASGLDLKKVTVGISVREVGTGALVADIGGSARMTPASNMKVLTTAAALRVLGTDFVYRTRLVRNGDRLTVIGDGDPSLGDPGMPYLDAATGKPSASLTADALIGTWVDAAKAAKITQVSELVVDDRIFDRQFMHPDWPDDQRDNSYCAEVSGLEFNVNLLQASIGTSGGRPGVTAWKPSAPWLAVESKAGANPKAKQSLWIGRTEDPWKFTLNGNMKQVPREPIAVCVRDMPTFFARYLGERMAGEGIKVGSKRVASATDATATGTPIGQSFTRALPDVVRQCNTESQNMYAESLLKRMGAKRSGKSGTWENGAAALAAEVDAALGAGAAKAGLTVADGSGLSRKNEVAPNLLSAWLRAIAMDPRVGPAFIGSLAVAGKSGTVKDRFKDLDTNRVFVPCKTGYINGVSCLSGFVGAPGQAPRFTFSILCNDLDKDKNGVHDAKALQEKIVGILAGGL